MIDDSKTLKLVDFGLTEQMNIDTITTFSMQKSTMLKIKGTFRYMAPEMIELLQTSSKDIRKTIGDVYEFARKADVYSLGLVIFDAYLVSVLGFHFEDISRKVDFIETMIEKIQTRNSILTSLL